MKLSNSKKGNTVSVVAYESALLCEKSMSDVLKNSVERFRKERGITQEQLAECVGVTRQTIIALEKGHYGPSLILALKIARFFGEPVEVLFTLK